MSQRPQRGTSVGRGSWTAVLATAGTALGVALVLCLFAVFLFDPARTTSWDKLVLSVAAALSALTVGGVVEVSADEDSVTAGLGMVPLLVTTLSLGGAAYVFRRLSRGTTRLGDALLDAVRASLVLGVLAFLLSLVFRTSLSGLHGQVSDLLWFLGVDDIDIAAGSNRLTSFFVATLVMFLALAVASLLRRDWLPPAGQRVHDLLAAPLHGLGAFVVLLPVAGAVSYLSLLTGDSPEEADLAELGWNERFALGVVGASNAGLHYLGLGAGAKVGAGYELRYEGGEESDQWWGGLSTVVGETDMWGMWLSVPLTLLVLAAAALAVVRASRGGSTLVALAGWCGVMVLAFPWLARLASFRTTGDLRQGDDDATFAVFVGLPSGSALLLALVGIGVTLAVAGATDVRGLAGRSRDARERVPDPSRQPPPQG